jgi:WD repeat-containing protein 35
LRRKIGDWFRVLQLLKNGSSTPVSSTNTLENDATGISSALTIGTDSQLEEAYNAIGDHYKERQQWNQAITYYVQGRNISKLADCYYILEEFDSLIKLLDQFTDNHEFLSVIRKRVF